jgi:gliding motility-associated-like protein
MNLKQKKRALPLWFSFFVLFGGIPFISFAQFGILWETTVGGSGWEEQNGIVPLPEVNQYVFGGFSGSEISHEMSSDFYGAGDAMLMWMDSSGVFLREKRYGGSGFDRINNLIRTNDGNLIFVGTTTSPMDGTLDSPGFGCADIWVVKLDIEGNIIKQKRFGGEFYDEGVNIVTTPDGRFLVIAEEHESSPDCNIWPFPPSKMWAFQLDANLEIIWDRRYTRGSDLKNKPTSIVNTPDNGFIIGGESWAQLDANLPGYTGNNWYYFKIDISGNVLWEKHKGGGNQDAILDIVPTIDDNFLIMGFTDANETYGMGVGESAVDSVGFGKEDMLLMKVDQNGNEIWEKRYGGQELDWGYSAVQNQLGNYIVIGVSRSDSIGTKTSQNLGENDFWVLHLNSEGDVIWDQSFGGQHFDSCTKIAHALGGGYIIGGHSQSGVSDDKSGFNRGTNDQWILRTGCQIFSPELPDIEFICEGEQIEVDATVSPCTGCIYTWSDGSNESVRSITADGTIPEYSLYITHKDACEVFDTFAVNVVPNPTSLFLEVDSVTCFGDSDGAIYIDGVESGTAPFRFDINGQIFTSVADLPTFQNLEAGFFEIAVEDANGCKTDTTILVEHPEEPLVFLPDDIQAELGDSFKIQALVTPNIVSFQWTNPDILSCSDCLEPYMAPQQTTSVGIIVKDKNGCTAQDGMTIFISKDDGVYVPNVFSPNGDGDNEFLSVYAKPNISIIRDFTIYDRWGEQMFSRQDFSPNQVYLGWDGRFRGKNAPRAVYIYSLTYERVDGQQETVYGDFTLMK